MRTQPTHGGLIVAILGTSFLPGCVHLDQTAQAPPRPPTIAEPTPELSNQQAAEVHVGLGRSLEKRGDISQAMAAYQEAQKRDPNCLAACLRLGALYDRQGKFQESAAQYARAVKLAPKNPDVYCDLGYSLYLQRGWADAESNLRKAISLKADHSRARNNLGLVLARTDRLDEAAAEFRQGGCSAADAYVNVAFALTLDRRWQEARSHYQRPWRPTPLLKLRRAGYETSDALMAKAPQDQARGGDRGPIELASPIFPAK